MLKISISVVLVAGFSICLTALTSLAPRLNLDEFRTGLYLWPLMLWDVLNLSNRRLTILGRLLVFALYIGLGYSLWLIWGWSIWVFLPAFVLGLPIVWMIGAAMIIVGYTILEPISVKRSP